MKKCAAKPAFKKLPRATQARVAGWFAVEKGSSKISTAFLGDLVAEIPGANTVALLIIALLYGAHN